MSLVRPHYGWYGDDFTGATDTLATIAERGYRAFLFLEIPDEARLGAVGELDAIGLAGAARTMDQVALEAELAPVGPFFGGLGVRLMHFKCCSTFDSAPETGNLATAIAALRPYAEARLVPIIGGQPSLGRYCVFSNLFAAANDETYRLDRHPTMSLHPVTPMHEADLRLHLSALGLRDIAAITWPMLDADATGACSCIWAPAVPAPCSSTPLPMRICRLSARCCAAPHRRPPCWFWVRAAWRRPIFQDRRRLFPVRSMGRLLPSSPFPAASHR